MSPRYALFIFWLVCLLPPCAFSAGLDETYVDLLSAKKFAEAFSYLMESGDGDREAQLVIGYHLMFGTDVKQDECAAVRIFEKQYDPDHILDRAETALNLIYAGGWAFTAAKEGSRQGALAAGIYYSQIPDNLRFPMLNRISYYDEKSLYYFKLAKMLGSTAADYYISLILSSNPKLNIDHVNRLLKLYEPVSIVCPIRTQ